MSQDALHHGWVVDHRDQPEAPATPETGRDIESHAAAHQFRPEVVASVATVRRLRVRLIGLGILTLSFPVAAFGVAGVLIVLILLCLGTLSRAACRRLAPGRPQPES